LNAEKQAFAEQICTPHAALDARRRVLAAIVRRQGQGAFRQQLLLAYEGRCGVTGCDVEAALEAAHIEPYQGPHSNDITNGLLLRADVHTLFDLGYLAVDGATMTIRLALHLMDSAYAFLAGALVRLPAVGYPRPSATALEQHRAWSGL
jgi:predicted restriction endonuclease